MKKTLLSLMVVAVLSLCNQARCENISPELPSLSQSQASVIFTSIRKAMREYILYRPAFEKQKFSLKSSQIDTKDTPDYPVCVTLRRNGRVVGSGFSRGRGFENNSLCASLNAIRCPGLGDKVTTSLLDSLTIELEIMGPEIKFSQKLIEKNIIPGLIGVKLAIGIYDPKSVGTPMARAYQEIRVSPATQYIKGYSPADSVEQALRGIENRPQSRNLKSTWSIYRAMHFVDYPKSAKPIFLYRGKIFQLKPNNIEFLARVCKAVADAQDNNGEIVMPNNRQGRLWENAYLAYALKKGAINIGSAKNDKLKPLQTVLENSGNLIMGYFAKQYIGLNDDGQLRSAIPQADNPLLTAAFLLLACDCDANVKSTAKIKAALHNYLIQAIGKDGRILTADSKDADVLTHAIVVNALIISANRQGVSYDKKLYNSLDRLLGRCGVLNSPATKVENANIEELSWATMAIMQAEPATRQQYLAYLKKLIAKLISSQQKYTKVLDQTGGLLGPTGEITSAGTATGMSVFIKMNEISNWPQGPEMINLTGEFCWMMAYRPGEAYFAAKPSNWTGWLRVKPQAAEISIHATASVVNALADKIAAKK